MQRRIALSIPFDDFSLGELAAFAAEADSLGYTDAWSSETDGYDGFTPLAAIAGATNMRLGIAIANVFNRGPAVLAQTAAGIADLAPGRFVLGVGSGSQVIVERWNGAAFRRPVTRVRETVQFLRQALAGERVVFDGATLQVDGFRLLRPPAQPIPIHVAGLRPGMLSVAGELADGAIINWLGATDVPRSVAVVRQAAERAGRDPAAIEITARLMVLVDDDGSEAADVAKRRHIAAYLNVPVYAEFHRWLGRGAALAPMWDAWSAGDRKAATASIPPRVISELLLSGSIADIRAHVRAYLDAGVDTAFLAISSLEPDRDRRRNVILEAHRALAPAVGGYGA